MAFRLTQTLSSLLSIKRLFLQFRLKRFISIFVQTLYFH